MHQPRRHIFLPDLQAKKGVPLDHVPWVGEYVVDQKPDVVVIAGDWFDFPSLSTHDEPGTLDKEGRRFIDDLNAGNVALDALMAPISREIKRTKRFKAPWQPQIHVTLGNHEDRLQRYINKNPVLEGAVGYHQFAFEKHGIKVHDFGKPVVLDGIAYAHYWSAQMTGRAYGGTAANILTKLGHSFTQGHRQVFEYASRNSQVTGLEQIGLIAGAMYVHAEPYLGYQANSHFRGLVVKNEVRNGHYDIMRVSLDKLCRKYENKHLRPYLERKYRDQDWTHIK